MTWVKLDDSFADHPKVLAAGPLASWLYVCGLTYCSRLLTDGFIPTAQVRRLADVDNSQELAAKLVSVGLWDVCENGYQIHDYLAYNPSADSVKSRQEYDRLRKNSARNPNGIQTESIETQNGFHALDPVVDPVPDPDPVIDPSPVVVAPAASIPATDGANALSFSFEEDSKHDFDLDAVIVAAKFDKPPDHAILGQIVTNYYHSRAPCPDIMVEIAVMREWLESPRQKGKRVMTLGFFRNWLKKAEETHVQTTKAPTPINTRQGRSLAIANGRAKPDFDAALYGK